MQRTITIVSGFQRCGSSLVCQMLAAGGMEVYHDAGMGYPAFETHMQLHGVDAATFVRRVDGKAVKWLEPVRGLPPGTDRDVRVIWMTRNHREQARSAVKFLRLVGGLPVPSSARRAMEASYRKDEPRSRQLWTTRGTVLVESFEKILADPHACAERFTTFIGRALDTKKMAAAVRPRDPACLDGLLELLLIAER